MAAASEVLTTIPAVPQSDFLIVARRFRLAEFRFAEAAPLPRDGKSEPEHAVPATVANSGCGRTRRPPTRGDLAHFI
jgi:hypothetical protein